MIYNFREKYDPTKSYAKKDVVSYQSNQNDQVRFYLCLTAHDSSSPQSPTSGTDNLYWGVLNTLSNFPNSIDTFLYRNTIQPKDMNDINRISELRGKTSLTADEQTELNDLLTKQRDKFFLAEDVNALQQSVTNLQMYFLNNVDGTLQNAKADIQTNKDSALSAIEQKKNNVIEYMDDTTAGALRNDIGIMGDLTTENKNSLVNAINEVNAKPTDMYIGDSPPTTNTNFWLDTSVQ